MLIFVCCKIMAFFHSHVATHLQHVSKQCPFYLQNVTDAEGHVWVGVFAWMLPRFFFQLANVVGGIRDLDLSSANMHSTFLRAALWFVRALEGMARPAVVEKKPLVLKIYKLISPAP